MVISVSNGEFQFEDCLLKHHVRRHGWLPLCKQRLSALRKASRSKSPRRLRYFTFCAIGAIDVLMLEIEKVLKKSDGRFDTVFFFDKDRELVNETNKRIPGAIGFPGEFVDVVLAHDPGGDALDVLDAPANQEDNTATRRQQILFATHRDFISYFPFDVINLDLERFLFRPNDPFPGRLVNAMRKLFEWQRNTLIRGKQRISVDSFTLLFTTQIGPRNLSNDYRLMLRNCVLDNLQRSPELVNILRARSGTSDVVELERAHFETFFKISMPKIVASILHEEDWYIDDDVGVRLFEFERESERGPYRILHLAMDVKRKEPPRERRAPGEESQLAVTAYRNVTQRIFAQPETLVTMESVDVATLQENLTQIKAHRRRYHDES